MTSNELAEVVDLSLQVQTFFCQNLFDPRNVCERQKLIREKQACEKFLAETGTITEV